MGNKDPGCKCDPPGDGLRIVGVEMNDEDFLFSVNHGGGCQKHSYTLSACNRILSSEPPQQGSVLVHDAKGDECDAEFFKILRV